VSTLAGTGRHGGFTFHDGAANASEFAFPTSLAIDSLAEPPVLYVVDYQNSRVRRYSHATGEVTTVAGGNGTRGFLDNCDARESLFNEPRAIALDAWSDTLYVADSRNNRVRSITGLEPPGIDGTGPTAASHHAPTRVSEVAAQFRAEQNSDSVFSADDNETFRLAIEPHPLRVFVFAGTTGEGRVSAYRLISARAQCIIAS
jgi:DNA-binding beta-propeller fold protein YncE